MDAPRKAIAIRTKLEIRSLVRDGAGYKIELALGNGRTIHLKPDDQDSANTLISYLEALTNTSLNFENLPSLALPVVDTVIQFQNK